MGVKKRLVSAAERTYGKQTVGALSKAISRKLPTELLPVARAWENAVSGVETVRKLVKEGASTEAIDKAVQSVQKEASEATNLAQRLSKDLSETRANAAQISNSPAMSTLASQHKDLVSKAEQTANDAVNIATQARRAADAAKEVANGKPVKDLSFATFPDAPPIASVKFGGPTRDPYSRAEYLTERWGDSYSWKVTGGNGY